MGDKIGTVLGRILVIHFLKKMPGIDIILYIPSFYNRSVHKWIVILFNKIKCKLIGISKN